MNRQEQETCINPNNSVVVTACAGSGKTWLLTSRIIRIILENADDLKIDDGQEGGEQAKGSFQLSSILAITFTNNAAAEIQKRVRDRLHEMAHELDGEALAQELAAIGLKGAKYSRAYLKEVHRKFLLARPQLSVLTFHSWFQQLINYLPWEMRPSLNSMVADNTEDLKLQAWQRVLRSRIKDGSDEAEAMEYLLGCHKLPDLRKLLAQLFERRSDWFLYYGVLPEDAESGAEAYKQFENKLKENIDLPPVKRTPKKLHENKDFIKDCKKTSEFCLNSSHNNLKKKGEALKEALATHKNASPEDFFENIKAIVLQPSSGKPSQTFDKCSDCSAYGEMLKELQRTIAYESDVACLDEVRQYNKACARLAILYFQEYKEIKKEEGVIDYADMEFYPLRALVGGADSVSVETMLGRMDAAYKHILVDEFQDSNPVQWRLLRAWLEETEQKGPGERPSVFIVGDPKQSIYSFRNGNPRLLQTAREYLCNSPYDAKCVETNLTRRCAQPLVEALNKLFSKGFRPELGFKPHDTDFSTPHSSLRLLEPPAIETPKKKKKGKEMPNPLDSTIQLEESETNAYEEGKAIAQEIKRLVGKKIIYNKDGEVRECKPGDIMLLYPSSTNIDSLINALIEAELPCALPASTNRMEALECQDMVALLHAIFDPGYNLMLAQVLRSPVFGLDEDDLWKVLSAGKKDKEQKYSSWSWGLKRAAEEPDASDRIKNAHELLKEWRRAYRNDKLPTHEMLSKCFDEANIIKNYAEAVPPEMRKRTVLNLEWLLNHSLDASRGSLVLLSEYVDYLRGLAQAEEKSDADAEQPDTIRVLTVHKAKGLQSPIVFLANCNYKPGTDGNQLVVSWRKGGFGKAADGDVLGKTPAHVSFYRSAKKTSGQVSFVDSKKETRQHENSNLMYVAMTRASQHLILSKRAGKGHQHKWWDEAQGRLFSKATESDGGNEATDASDIKHCWGESPQEADSSVPLQKTKDDEREGLPEEPKKLTKPATKKIPPTSEPAIRGTQLHNLLALILQGVEDPSTQRRLLGIGKGKQKELMETVDEILDSKTDFGKLLADKKSIECELPAVDGGGNSKRIDCLLTTKDDTVWVLDFKTGDTEKSEDEHNKQMLGYHKIVKRHHDKVRIGIIDSEGALREVPTK